MSLYQRNEAAKAAEIGRAIEPILNGTTATVHIRDGFLVEELLLEESRRLDADLIVLGRPRKRRWRRVISRIIGGEPDIEAYLKSHSPAAIELAD